MNTRIVPAVIAAALTVAAASSAPAQEAGTLNVRGARIDAPVAQTRGLVGVLPVGSADRDADAATTGSIDRPRAARGTDGSAYRYSGPHAGGPANGLTRN